MGELSLEIIDHNSTPNLVATPSRKSPLASVLSNVQSYYCLESAPDADANALPPHEAWLPLTESRNGNALYAAFHTLCSGIGFQALLLPLAFTTLGWTWGILWLALVFAWQLYTTWVLIQLHESEDCGMRYSRYLGLSMAAFGEKVGKLLALFPTMYLSGGTCVTLIMIGGGSLKAFFQIIITNYYDNNNSSSPLSTVEWYIVFTFAAVMLSQFLPNLNSVARVSLIGAVTAISYCALILAASLLQGRISHPDHQHVSNDAAHGVIARVCGVINGVGIVAFAFRGHNLVLEIQGTMPSSGKTLSKVPMWRGVQIAYLIIALCLFPLAIGGHWAYGNLIPTEYGGMLNALYKYHGRETSNIILGSASLLIVINSISSFQIYAMPAFDNLELRYTSKTDKPCPWWLRSGLRLFFGCLTCFIAVALPFLPSLAGLIGGIALPLTLAYPCFMWIAMKKPAKYSGDWCLNWGLGVSGMVFSVLVVAAAIGTIVTKGIEVHFFKP
ncbi:Lysine histidine transporter-like 8 [Linum perenne]